MSELTRQEEHDLKVRFQEAPHFHHTRVLSEAQWGSWIKSGRNYSLLGLDGQDTVFTPLGRWSSKDYECVHQGNKVAIRHTETDITVDGGPAIQHDHILLDKDGADLAVATTVKKYSESRWIDIQRRRRSKMFELLEISAKLLGLENQLEIIFTAFVLEKLSYVSAGKKANGDSALKTSILAELQGNNEELKEALNTPSPNPAHHGALLYQVILSVI